MSQCWFCSKSGIYWSLNQSNFYSANIPSVARLSGATVKSADHIDTTFRATEPGFAGDIGAIEV